MKIDKRVYQFCFYMILLLIEYLATTTQEIEVIQNIWDKANHFMAFFVLYILLSMAYEKLTILKRVALLFLYGWQIEFVQSFIPGRFFSLYDIVADTVGIFIGVVLYYAYEKIKSSTKEASA
jgi:VanZ family protein